MAAITNKKHMQMKAEMLSKKTKFQKCEIEALLSMYAELTKNTGKLDRTRFRDILHNQFKMTDDIIMDRVFRVFDADNDTNVSADEWVKGLSTFLKGNIDDQIRFCFSVFDMNADGFISRDEIFHLLKNCIIKQPNDEDPDEGVKDLVDITIKRMDFDNDTRLSLSDFQQSVKREEILLEAFGQCLPVSEDAQEVITALQNPDGQQDLLEKWSKNSK